MRTKVELPIFVQKLLTEWFPTGEDVIWKQWADRKPRAREWSDLIGLLTLDVRDSFKRRALYLLVVPSEELNLVYWKEKGAVGRFYGEKKLFDTLRSLSLDLLIFVAELVTAFCLRLKKLHDDRSRDIAEGGGGITLLMQVPGEWHDALSFYNRFILRLLALLPREKGEDLFPLYSLRDISTYYGMEDASGYTPFGNLLYLKELDEYWKVKADSAMREIIRRELAGKSKPREEWENAFSRYAGIIEAYLWNDSPYSVALFESQMRFLVEHHNATRPLIEGRRLSKIFDIFSGDERKGLRYEIARALILGYAEDDWRRFSVHDEEGVRTAHRVMEEFPSDVELVGHLRSHIESYKRWFLEDARREAQKKKQEEDILAQMK